MLGCSCTLFNKKEIFKSKYLQLLVAKDFPVAEKRFISLSVEENMTQERRHLRKDAPQMLKQQIPNHQLHKISHKMNPSLNNSHKMNPSLNSSHKVRPPLNNHKVKQLILSHLNPAIMIHHFQIMPQLSKLLRQKTPALYQRN